MKKEDTTFFVENNCNKYICVKSILVYKKEKKIFTIIVLELLLRIFLKTEIYDTLI